MINPVNHGVSSQTIATYKAEPYTVAADVYAKPPHTGRGGWTWYTGSAGWMYRLILESLLGVRLEVDKLYFEPLLPSNWNAFKLHYRFRDTIYHITIVSSPNEKVQRSVTVDGVVQERTYLHLIDDHKEHTAEITF
jgi:cellobiose phosphorylase